MNCIPLNVVVPVLAVAGTAAFAAGRRLSAKRQARRHETAVKKFSKLYHLSGRIATPCDSRQNLEPMLRAALESMDLNRGFVGVASPDNKGFACTFGCGMSDSAIRQLSQAPLCDYLLERADHWSRMMVMPDLRRGDAFESGESDPGFASLMESLFTEDFRSVVVLGLNAEKRPRAVLILGSDRPRRFSPSELRLLEAVAYPVTTAFENHSLQRLIQRQKEEMEVLRRVGEKLGANSDLRQQFGILKRELPALLGVRNFWISFQDAADGHTETLAAVEGEGAERLRKELAGKGLSERVLSSRAPWIIGRDVRNAAARLGIPQVDPQLRFWCGVPIHFSDGTVGVFAAADYEREDALDERQFHLLQVLAREVGAALENTRLSEREQRRQLQLALLNEVGRTTAATLSPKELTSNLCRQIRTAFACDMVRFETRARKREGLLVEAQEGYAENLVGQRFPISQGLPGLAAETGEIALANEATAEPRYVPIDSRVRSAIALPVRYGAEVLGVLSLESLRENSFSEQDILILRTLADQVALALHSGESLQLGQEQAITDALTRLKTHRFFMEALEAEWRRAPRTGHPFSIIMLDLDGFKSVNDRFGHLEGDRVLVAVGRLLASRTRQVNVIARYGGDEFAISMPETTTEQAEILAERLRASLASDPYLASYGVTASFGIAAFPAHGATTDELLRVADGGMFLAKHAKGNCVRVAGRAGASGKAEWEQKLLEAYWGVTVKRLFSTGPDAFEKYLKQIEEAAPSAKGQVASLMDTVTALAFAIDAKDHYTQGHSQSVSRLAVQLARQLQLSEAEVEEVRLAGILHDIGKIGIPEQVLNKPSRLTEDEYETVKSHTILGEKILGPLKGKGMNRIRLMVRHHHETVDGRGYPDGLRGENIPLGARILTVADSFDTMVSSRAYKHGRTLAAALAELQRCAGTHFDPPLVEAFIQCVAPNAGRASESAPN
jgi:diguanylate cyclase (GGDEF)-like protein/putative nucleotidyltransferase with HDIG domain